MGEDLPTQEAVLGGEVAFDVGEAQHAAGFGVGQQQRGQAAHRVACQVETADAGVVEHSPGGRDQERDRDAGQVCAPGLTAAGGVVGQERAARERGLAGDVEVVLLGGPEAMLVPDIGGGCGRAGHGCLVCKVW